VGVLAGGGVMAASWCKVASNLDSHPKIRKAGRNGREVFLFALRRNAEPGRAVTGVTGILPAVTFESWYLADQLMMSEAEATEGFERCLKAGLLTKDGEAVRIGGWDDDEWGRPFTNAERQQRHRVVTKSNATVTEPRYDVTRNNESNGREERRSEEKRGEETTKNSATPTASGSHLEIPVSKAKGKRKAKPGDHTAAECESVRVVLEKLSAQNGVRYSGTAEHARLIVNHLRAGIDEMDLRAVIGYCALELNGGWKGNPDMEQYLRPETLFGPKTISKYLDPARTWFAKLRPDKPPTTIPEVELEAPTDWMQVLEGGAA
jgi:uncharacterized phage protein (TIGR02220 family)